MTTGIDNQRGAMGRRVATRVRHSGLAVMLAVGCAGCNAIFGIEDSILAVDASVGVNNAQAAGDANASGSSVDPASVDAASGASSSVDTATPDSVAHDPVDASRVTDSTTDTSPDNGAYPADASMLPPGDGSFGPSATSQTVSSDVTSEPTVETTTISASGSTSDAAEPPPEPPCGNGERDGDEACDDENLESGDGCSAECKIESGWSCEPRWPAECTAICGDGMLVGDEDRPQGCDDGNDEPDDGCSRTCEVEPGYRCGVTSNGTSLCTNVDECAEETDNCDAHATCGDTDGSFECTCNTGYAGTGTACTPRSCENLASNCGVNQNEDCCASGVVTGGSFDFQGSIPATIATFALDKYEVTVGRFRQFVAAYAGPPAAGAGAHPLIANSGWDATWNSEMPSTANELMDDVSCNSTYQTWDSSGANDRLPMNCVNWYEALAFCAWDGGRLPTEAEWEYAATGGAEQRDYPWGSAEPNSTLAVYDCLGDGSAADDCSFEDILAVGSKPAGSGKYGQLDLAGSMWEWSLDSYSSTLPLLCDNCASLSSGSYRVGRGGYWSSDASYLRAVSRYSGASTSHANFVGLRCARSP